MLMRRESWLMVLQAVIVLVAGFLVGFLLLACDVPEVPVIPAPDAAIVNCGEPPEPPAYGIEFTIIDGREIVYMGTEEYLKLESYMFEADAWIKCND